MAFKILAFACFVAVARAGLIAPVAHYAAAPVAHYGHAAPVAHYGHAAPVAHYAAAPVAHYAAAPVAHYAAPAHYAAHAVEVSAPAEYNFDYSVHDEHTGDIKSQQESRHGDNVQGSYSLIEADGTRRVVEYTADEHNGFNAVVHKEPAQHAVKVVAPIAHVAPVAHYAHAAPVAHYAHAAPVAHYAHAAPVAHYAHAAPVAHYGHAAPVAHYAAPAHSYYH